MPLSIAFAKASLQVPSVTAPVIPVAKDSILSVSHTLSPPSTSTVRDDPTICIKMKSFSNFEMFTKKVMCSRKSFGLFEFSFEGF